MNIYPFNVPKIIIDNIDLEKFKNLTFYNLKKNFGEKEIILTEHFENAEKNLPRKKKIFLKEYIEQILNNKTEKYYFKSEDRNQFLDEINETKNIFL